MVIVQPNTPSPERSVQGKGKKIAVEDAKTVDEKVTSHVKDTDTAEDPHPSYAAAAAGFDKPAGGGSPMDAGGSQESQESAAKPAGASSEKGSETIKDASGGAAKPAGTPPEKEPAEGEKAQNADEVIAQAKAEAQEWQDKFLRLHAEWDTYRRRTGEQRKTERILATEKLVTSLIPVIDDFERTIDYAVKNGEIGLLDGVRAVHAKFIDVLKCGGVDVINPEGEAFDALEAQAVAMVDDKDVPDETVHEVFQKGFRMGPKVLRPAMVVVATGGPKREKPQEEQEKE